MNEGQPCPQAGRVWKKIKLPAEAGGFEIFGYSRAADRTFFYVPSLHASLDAGMLFGRSPATVFLTHTHLDHSYDLHFAFHKERADGGMDMYLPAESIDFVDRWLRATVELDVSTRYDEAQITSDGRLRGVRDGDCFDFGRGQRKFSVRVLGMHHKVPCVGFAFSEHRRRLRHDLVGKSREEIAALSRAGTEVNEAYLKPLFVYMGDTHARVFQTHAAWIFDFPAIITECTFFHEDDEIFARCERDGHTHWRALQPVILAHPHIHWILIHWSLRYKDTEVLEFFREQCRGEHGDALSNVTIFVGGYEDGRHSSGRHTHVPMSGQSPV